MSSCSLSGVADLLRVTVALPVSVATFPIGSSLAGWSGGLAAVAGEVGGVGACAIVIGREVAACTSATGSLPSGDGIAKTPAAPAGMTAQTSQSAKESRGRVTMVSPKARLEIGGDRGAIEGSAG